MATIKAGMVLMIVAHTADRLSIAIRGKRASPSWERALPNNAAKGTRPRVKRVTKILCGPQPGMIPIKTPMITAIRPVWVRKL